MKNYYRVMLGQGSSHAHECFDQSVIGIDFGIDKDVSVDMPEEPKLFRDALRPMYLKLHPNKSKIAAGLACGALWTISQGLKKGDIVLSPDGSGNYSVGEVNGPYVYVSGNSLPHQRPVKWLNISIVRTDMSEALQNSAGSIGTISTISQHAEELEQLIGGRNQARPISSDGSTEIPSAFALEDHLEQFLVKNWELTELGKEFDIYEEDGKKAQQYPTDTGNLDILAISKDRKKLLVVELKRERASAPVVGQILRYMGYVQEELANDDQTVEGVIVAHEDDKGIRRALQMVPFISFYRYQIDFTLKKDDT